MVGLETLLVLALLLIIKLVKKRLERRVELQPQQPPQALPKVEEPEIAPKVQPAAAPPQAVQLVQQVKPPEKVEKKRKKRKKFPVAEDPDTAATVVAQSSPQHEQPFHRVNSQPVSAEYIALGPFKSSIELDKQERLDEICNEIHLIQSTFPREFEQLIPHTAQMVGLYKTTLSEEEKKITVQWNYSIDSVRQPASLKLAQVEGTKLFEEQARYIIQTTDLGQSGFPVFELLLLLNDLVGLRDNNDSSPSRLIQEQQINKTSQIAEKPEASAVDSAMNNTRRNQQYGEFIDQYILTPYLQGDFRQAPEFDIDESKVSMTRNIQPNEQQSRYESEFREIRKLGEGGFGSVFLAKNLLDYNNNAVKKIKLNVADPFSRKVRKEVILLSSLNHPNIVRYYQSWIEQAADLSELCNKLCIEGSEERQQLEEEYQQYLNQSEDGEIHIGQKSSQSQSEHDEDLGGISDISNHTSFFIREHNPLEQDITEKKSSESNSSQSRVNSHRNKSFPFRIMYIAMEYCDGNTLKDLIANQFQGRKHDDKLEEFKILILRGILEALVYLHDKKIIHRDIKPANIFLDKKKQRIKLGDFGLATSMEEDLAEKGLVGTVRYKAPEQGENGQYSQKVDMYSLGIIIFEMFYCRMYGTESQREQTFKQLKEQKLPEDFDQYCRNPDIRELLKNLVSRNSSQRPSAKQLLSKVKNKLFVQLVSAITNPNHFEFRSLLNSLFQIKNSHCEGTHRDSFRRYNYAEIETLFRCHGGNNIHVTPMIPVQDYLQLNRKRVLARRDKKLLALSQEGGVFELSNSSYQPWLKWIRDYLLKNVKNKPRCIRRYSFCEVYEHEDSEEPVQHRERIVGVFDIVIDLNRQYLAKHQSELIKLSVQAANQKDCVVNISHSLLLKLLCEQLKFPEETLYKVLLGRQFDRTVEPPTDRWEQAFKEHEINDNISRRLIKYFKISATNPKEFIELLQSEELKGANFNEILRQLEVVERLIQCMEVNMVVYRLMIPHEATYGVFWKVVKNPEQNRNCVGGFTTMQEYHRGEEIALLHVEVELTVIPKPLVEVYVWSIGEVFEQEMVQIVNDCWDNGIYADWSNECMGQKVEGVRVGLILRKSQKRLQVSIRKFGSQQQTKVEWHALQNFNMNMLKTVLQEK